MKNNIVISLLVGVMSLLQLQAQDSKEEHRIHRQQVKKEMKAYMNAEVKPVINQQREKLDTYLSRKERKEVESIRTDMKELRARYQEFKQNIRESDSDPHSLSDDQKRISRELAKEKRALASRAWVIADAHEEEIAQLIDELEPNMETWRTDMRAIMKKNMPERKKEGAKKPHRKGKHPNMGRRGKHSMGPGRKMHGMALGKIKSPIGFLLWEGNGDLFQTEKQELHIFPNPTTASNTLKFTLKEPGSVKVNILNERGLLIKTLLQENRAAGTYTEKFDLSELEKGLYLYQIKTSEGINTKKLIIEK